MSAPVPQMTRTTLSRNPGILASRGNPTSYVQVDGRSNMSSVLTDWKPWPDLSPDNHRSAPEILAN